LIISADRYSLENMLDLNAVLIDLSPFHLSLLLPVDCHYIGTAVYGEGVGITRRVINLKVDENYAGENTIFEPPEKTIRSYAENNGWKEPSVGFLTSASMNSYASSRLNFKTLTMETHLTAGLSNARSAGDRAEYREIHSKVKSGGTINTIILCNTSLTRQSAIEILMISAAAKARVLQEMGVQSRVSQDLATGTGTDSTMILYPVSDSRNEKIEFAGMHTITGELAGRTVITALKKSLDWYLEN